MKFNSQLTQVFNDEIKKNQLKKKLTKKTELKRPSWKNKKIICLYHGHCQTRRQKPWCNQKKVHVVSP